MAKSVQELRAIKTTVRLTEAEREHIASESDACGISVSSFIRRRSMGKHIIPKTDLRVLAELRRMGGLLKHLHNETNGAYWIHYRDIAAKFTGTKDYSRIDAMVGVRMRATDYSQSDVQSAIENNAPAMRRENMTESEYAAKYRNRDWQRYAAETAERFVFGPRGAVQFEKALDYRPLYMRLEGRDAAEEDRQERERVERARMESKGSPRR